MKAGILTAGYQVVGLDSNLYLGSTFGSVKESFSEQSLARDIRDVVPADLAGFDAVIHLAALSNDPLGNLNPKLTYEINHQATVRLAQMAQAAGASRFIFSSSCSVYGDGGQEWLDENASFNPVTPYGRSKALAERALTQLAVDDFSPTFLRCATAYGVSARLRFDLVLNNLVAWGATTGRGHLKSDGASWRPLVHVEDMARAFVAVLQAPRRLVHNEAFNIGLTDENYRIRRLAEIVAETVPGSEIEYASDAGPDQRCYKVDCGKIARTLPDYQPQWQVQRGAEQLYGAYRQVGLKVADFEGPRYRRVHHIRQLMATGRLDETLRWRQPPAGRF